MAMTKRQTIQNFLAQLSQAEETFLLGELLAKNGIQAVRESKLAPAALSRLEKILATDLEKAPSPKSRNARWRLFFIFLLLRYAGLRMEEIFQIKAEDLQLAEAKIQIRCGKFQRIVPLSPKGAAAMREQIEKWPPALALDYPFRCDGSLIRRAFARCALKCGLSPHLLTARGLRQHRALELEHLGLPPELINLFLGRQLGSLDLEQGKKILAQAIENEQYPKTSARNAFYGELISLEKKGILVHCILETSSGLKVYASITESSRQNLGLRLGLHMRAIIKAPFVQVFQYSSALNKAPNHFLGQIKEVKRDAEAMEINILLPEGNLLCALYVMGQKPDFPLSEAETIGVKFSPFSVILITA